jgi:hypothetical protein
MGPDGLETRPTERCWAKLDEALGLAHAKPDAPLRAHEMIVGWTEQLGPCRPYLDPAELAARIASMAHGHAFEEIPDRYDLDGRLLRGYRRWENLRVRARTAVDCLMAAPPARV